jgi:hypothetical protein
MFSRRKKQGDLGRMSEQAKERDRRGLSALYEKHRSGILMLKAHVDEPQPSSNV